MPGSQKTFSQKRCTAATSWLTSTIVQYNNVDHLWGVNFRLNYIFRPGDDFFLIYNEGRRFQDSSGIPYGPNERTLQAKLTYSFDF